MCVIVLLAVLYGAWDILFVNETANTIATTSLLISVTALFITTYITIENSVELRNTNKKKLLSDYCNRFSSDPIVQKVARWLWDITDMNFDEIKVYPKKSKDDKGNHIEEPNSFEKGRFLVFLTELNIQTKNKQLEKEDVRKIFSLYALLFNKAQKNDNVTIYSLWKDCDYSELLPDSM
jgi:hypothetical protein